MSLVIRERHGKNYYYFRKGADKYLYLGPVDEPSQLKQDRVREALDYTTNLDIKNIELEYSLVKLLSDPKDIDEYVQRRLSKLDKIQINSFVDLMSQAGQKKYLELKITELETRLRRLEEEVKISSKFFSELDSQKQKTTKRNLKTLLINEDSVNSRLLSEYLRKTGHECEVADNFLSASALITNAFIQKKKYDVVLIDSSMFHGSHSLSEFLDRIDRTEDQKIILLVNSPLNKEDKKELKQLGIDSIIQKPAQLNEATLKILNRELLIK